MPSIAAPTYFSVESKLEPPTVKLQEGFAVIVEPFTTSGDTVVAIDATAFAVDTEALRSTISQQ